MKGHLYFIGIAGHAMRGLALAARDNGYTVSGLDEGAVPPGSDWLNEHKFDWAQKFAPQQLEGVTAVIVTGAGATPDHPAITAAQARKIPVKSFAQLFGELTADEPVIAVAGTHGKTTTTALIAWLLESAGRQPDYLVGIQPFNFESSVRLGVGKIAVVEADEYRASALETKSKAQYYHPDTLVLTSVEHDHPDMFPDLAAVDKRFREIVGGLPKTGRLIACAEAHNVLDIAAGAPCPVTTYGLSSGDFQPLKVEFTPAGIEFEVNQSGETLGRITVALYGRHNVLNALAATAAARSIGLSFDQIKTGMAAFKGAYRRFNIVSAPGAAVTVVDDYAHHPTEVATNLEAARLHFKDRRIIVVFRPHTYSRTAALLGEYRRAFADADVAIITDIEGARETGAAVTVSGQDIVDGLDGQARYEPNRDDLIALVTERAQPGDVILCLSVSGYQNLSQELEAKLVH